MAGKFGWICTAFPLATFSVRIFNKVCIKFPTKIYFYSISCKKLKFTRPILLSKYILFKYILSNYNYYNFLQEMNCKNSNITVPWQDLENSIRNIVEIKFSFSVCSFVFVLNPLTAWDLPWCFVKMKDLKSS